MRLNHLDLHVPDVAATRDFFVEIFDLTEIETRGINGLAILNDDAGLEVIISRPLAKFGGADQVTIGAKTYHVGFILPDRTSVNDVHRNVVQAGYEALHEPQEIRGGWLFYVIAPGQILVEVGCRG